MTRMANLNRFFLAILCVLCAFAFKSPLFSQSEAVNYPTLIALQNAQVTPADRVDLARRLLGVTDIPSPPTEAPLLQIGERERFWASNLSEEQTFEVTAVLRAVGEHSYLWVEDGSAVPDDALLGLAQVFDDVIYPEVRKLWGSESTPGIDGDPRIYGLFTPNLGGGTLAYYAGRHSYPDEVIAYSNEHEMMFFNLDTIGINLSAVESTLAHEFQHMIRSNIDPNEDTWLDEGFSKFTEYYLGYGDVLSVGQDFAFAPATQLNTWAYDSSNGVHYGAAMLFIIYFYERYGLEAIQALSADPANGLASFDNTLRGLGETGVDVFFADWALANVIQNSALEDGRYGYAGDVLNTRVLANVNAYPYLAAGTVNQYGTDIYEFTVPDEATTLTVTLTAPQTVSLVPAAAYSGQHTWYSNRADASELNLTRVFDLSDVQSATLTYQAWYQIEPDWDYAYVMASVDNGAQWDILPAPDMTSANPHGNAYGIGYSGDSGGWIENSVSLDAYAGLANVQVRFSLITDDAISLPGMIIDDVTIPEIGYFSDFESGEDGWQPQGWIWMDNVLPQQVWVQMIQFSDNDVTVTRWRSPIDAIELVPLVEGVERVKLTITPFAPVTTVPMPYTLTVNAR